MSINLAKKHSMISRLSDPNAVVALLALLRLGAIAVLLILFMMASLMNDAIADLISWSWVGLGVILALIASGLSVVFLKSMPMQRQHIFALLLWDTCLWLLLVSATGGTINPAMSYLLVLLSVAALSLSLWQSLMIIALMIALYTAMMQAQPMHHHHDMLSLHLWGMWLLFLLNALILLAVLWFLNRSMRAKDEALAVFREDQVRNEQLVAMGTLAANLAHDLGTPLSTIAMLAEDFSADDADIMKQQIDRCKSTLSQLKHIDIDALQVNVLTSLAFCEHMQYELSLIQPSTELSIDNQINQCVNISVLLERALLSLLNNAAMGSEGALTLVMHLGDMQAENSLVYIDIHQHGEKIDKQLLAQLGNHIVESNTKGMGIGYYLANASINSLGGNVSLSNVESGVVTRVSLPTQQIIVDEIT